MFDFYSSFFSRFYALCHFATLLGFCDSLADPFNNRIILKLNLSHMEKQSGDLFGRWCQRLKFDSEDHKSKHHRFSEIVLRSLLSHEAPVLESLKLVVRDETEALDVGIWIGVAFAHNLRKLVLDLHNEKDVLARVPSVVWSCSNKLETLKLRNSILLEFPSRVSFSSLRKLDLEYVEFKDEASISKLFSGCTSLQELFVDRQSNIDVKTFTIAVPSLQRLTVVDDFPGDGKGGYVINCPCLKYLSIKGFEWIEFCRIENLPELVEAKILGVSHENILVSLTSVKSLSLHLSPFKEIKFPIFHQLVSLELFTGNGWNLLPLMLDSSPNLRILKFVDPGWYNKGGYPVGCEWSQPICVPECLLFHLEKFVWTRYEWQREDEKEVALYFLNNARRLKKAILTTKPIEIEELKKLEKRREMLKQLASEVKSPNSCQLVFEYETFTCNKIGGKNFRGRDIVNEDRISELPEELLLQILSSVPTVDVRATSALSKRWRSLWKMVPKLKFNYERHESKHHSFSEIVCRTLLSHKAPELESLELVVRDAEAEPFDVGIWMGIAFAHNVRELVFDIRGEEPDTYSSVLWSCNNKLETLKFKNSMILEFPCEVCFKSLRKLHLDNVELEDEESASNLFSGCTSLEDLVVNRKSNSDVKSFTVAVPSLQRLTIDDDSESGQGVGGYVINAPSLKYLFLKGFCNYEFCLIEDLPELVEARIMDVSYVDDENILASLASVKRLSLHILPFHLKHPPTGVMFHQLVSLELFIQHGWNLVELMLDISPNLQTLKLVYAWNWDRSDSPIGCEWSQPECVPECLLFHLETFVWTYYKWKQEDNIEVALYILNNARRLKKATLTTKPIESHRVKKLEKRREMLKKLASEVKSPSSCELVFECEMSTCNKIGGKILRGRDIVNEDRISELPDDLLLQILSSVPTEDVIATSALSKRWRSVWKMVPKLTFNYERLKRERHRFPEIVCRTLLSHKAPELESLHLVARVNSEALDVGTWMRTTFARPVRELVLDLRNQRKVPVSLTSVLWRCSNKLDTLKLKNSIILEFPSWVCFSSLRKLHLEYVEFKDEASVSNLFSGCTSLQDLFVDRRNYYMDVGTFRIAVPSLQRLTIRILSCYSGRRETRYVINAPSLKCLSIKGSEWIKSCIFHELVSLELFTGQGWNLLGLMLDSSPKLQILKLTDPSMYTKKDCSVERGWRRSQPKSVPECLLFHLETFVWTRYEWQLKDEKEVALYILNNARRLKKATLSTKSVWSYELKKLEKRREMLKQLANEVKSPSSCQLVFEYDTVPFE
ncbi:unnamed protein product [Microthlaspi erraticum]|uniref:F-box domain-containing protein n=1 Tax=Microthlaspi erraticum TaxID=1685480 RepID=A0A6D2KSS5_9BRAS|nr:unnamed protein product [Microthlaspi erraticum]